MKSLKIYCTAVVLWFSSNTFGQNEIKRLDHKLNFTDLFAAIGFGSSDNQNPTLQEFRALAPGSSLLSKNLNGYEQVSSFSEYPQNNAAATVGFYAGINFANKDKSGVKPCPQLRIGVIYLSGKKYDYTLQFTEKNPYDTLTSSQTGESIFIDSVFRNTYKMKYNSDQLRLDVSLIFRLNSTSRVSFYSGIGTTFGFIFNTQTLINYYYDTWTEAQPAVTDNYYSYSNGYYNHAVSEEKIANKMGYGYSVYVPIGVDIRFGKKSLSWKRLHLFVEIKPAINSFSVPELPSSLKPVIYAAVGMRFSSMH